MLRSLAYILVLEGTLDGVQEAYDLVRSLLQLGRGDPLFMRFDLPYLMLRLNLDRECYHYVKWWALRTDWDSGDWFDLNIPGVDVLEDQEYVFLRRGIYANLGYIIPFLILKLKLLIDIRNLRVTRKVLANRLPNELQDMIEGFATRSPLSARLRRESPEDLARSESKLVYHCAELAVALEKLSPGFVAHLLDQTPGTCIIAGRDYPSGHLFPKSYPTWWETEGILDFLADVFEMNTDIMKSINDMGLPTTEDLLSSLDMKRFWVIGMREAFKNACYLGSPNPERHQRWVKEATSVLISTRDPSKVNIKPSPWSRSHVPAHK
ncbi:hypothetical protein F4808DRAFT_196509 [Astrocystis sublimbata]|nr:hypothetical protein F4808DRAFT_196509 [Astrocystis sublimbata]